MKTRPARAVISAIFCILLAVPSFAQNDTLRFFDKAPEFHQGRTTLIGATLGSAYVLSMGGLYSLWYKDYPMGSFHTFNDNAEWLQMDKTGHTASAYYLGKWGIDLFSWTGMDRKKAIWRGGSTGWIFLTTVEIFDGFSDQWGFSTGDMIANTAGSLMAITQQLAWDEQRIRFRFSFHQSKYAKLRPDQLGSGFTENIMKDYNGQTYWLSGNIHSFLPEESRFPRWINLAVGYGGEGMTGARSNDVTDAAGTTIGVNRYRQFYISPDIDLTRIRVRSRVLKAFLGAIGFIKFPMPALEIRDQGTLKMHWLYF